MEKPSARPPADAEPSILILQAGRTMEEWSERVAASRGFLECFSEEQSILGEKPVWWWFSHWVVSDSLQPCGPWPTRLLCPWDSPGKSTGVGCHCLLQGILPTQESNPGLLHCRQILYQLSYEGSVEWKIVKVKVRKGKTEKEWIETGVSPAVLDSSLCILLHQVKYHTLSSIRSFPGSSAGRRIRLQFRRPGFTPWVGNIPLEEGMETHSCILAWRIPMDRGVWQATIHGVTKSQTLCEIMTEWLSTAQHE